MTSFFEFVARVILLPQREAGRGDVDHNCAVCMEEYTPDDLVRLMSNCTHFFHAECCEKWIRVRIALEGWV